MNEKASSLRRLIVTLVVIIAILGGVVAGALWGLQHQTTLNSPPQSSSPPDKSKNTPDQPAVTSHQVKIAYIAVGDNGQSGEMIGCGDSVVLVDKTVQAASAVEGALKALLANKTEHYGASGLYNVLWQSRFMVDSVTVANHIANVALSGQMQLSGECDNPRVKAQIESTVKASSDATTVNVTINDKTLDEALSLK